MIIIIIIELFLEQSMWETFGGAFWVIVGVSVWKVWLCKD